jgi:glycosyltransferase involved in cell wall biosynthesis
MYVLGVGRTDVRVMREASALCDAGYAVTIVDIERDQARPRREVIQGIQFRHLLSPSFFQSARFKPWFLVKMVVMQARGVRAVAATPADVYHAHDETALPACYVASRLWRKRLVYDAHELPLAKSQGRRWRWLETILRDGLRKMAPRAAGIITVSAPIADEIHRQFGGPMPVLSRNIPEYRPPDEAHDTIRRTLQLPPGAKVALYQGAFQLTRNLDLLVRAAHYLDANQVIALMGSGPTLPSVEALARAEGVTERVRFLPPAPYEDLLQWTASADICLIPYRASYSLNVRYCLPNKLFEYVMAGTPVVATELDAVGDILRRYDVGVEIPSLEPEVMGRAINALLADDAARARMRANALAAAKAELRWEVERERLIAFYAQILGVIPHDEERQALVLEEPRAL